MVKQSTKSKAKSTAKKPATKAAKVTKKVTKAPVNKTVKTTPKAKVSVKEVKTNKSQKFTFLRGKQSVKAVKAEKPAKAARNKSVRIGKLTALSPRGWNTTLAVLYVAQAAAILIASKTVAVPITLTYLAGDALATKASGLPEFSTALQHLFDLNIAYAVAGVLFALGVAHAVGATIARRQYESGIANTASSLRWVVSFLSVAGSFALVGLAIGVRDVVSVIALVAFVLISSLVAYVAELLARDKAGAIHKTFLYRIQFIAYFAPLVALAVYLVGSSVYDGQLPVYTNWLFAITVVVSFFLTSILRMQLAAENKWANYAYAERAYLLTAFVLTSSVAWQIFAGLLK